MSTGGRRARTEQAEQTRALILATAERLFAERGVHAVSNRQVGEAAGQGNNAAVAYHFGTKTDLVRAIIQRHAVPTERIRRRLLAVHAGSADLRDWVTCVVRPITDHLADLGHPSWYARFSAQLMTEPALLEVAAEEFRDAMGLHTVIDGLQRCLPDLSEEVRQERTHMAHTLLVHFCAQREREAAPVWGATAAGLIDAIVGLFTAPVT
ncbi:TetR/AcrR family transcriptional regulator [Actinoplanes sp. CA-252034]|uniref:TetR/AcrR family transcriptional regulator n=1 Tax=Actinoplanes sp. CA-252034 TaxID=3239906 RepID=UPI003D98868D